MQPRRGWGLASARRSCASAPRSDPRLINTRTLGGPGGPTDWLSTTPSDHRSRVHAARELNGTGARLRKISYDNLTSILRCTHTHTHPFNGPLSGTTRVSRYQKCKNSLDFTEARDSEWQWHQLGHMQVCSSLQTDNHTSTPPLCFLQAGCPSCRPTNSVKALKARVSYDNE